MGNLGQQKGGLKTPLIAAFAAVPLKYYMDETTAHTIMVLLAAYAFDSFEKQWKPRSKSNNSCMK